MLHNQYYICSTKLFNEPNPQSLVLLWWCGQLLTGPMAGRVIGYVVNFVPPGANIVTINKGPREMFHVIGEDEVPLIIMGITQVQVHE